MSEAAHASPADHVTRTQHCTGGKAGGAKRRQNTPPGGPSCDRPRPLRLSEARGRKSRSRKSHGRRRGGGRPPSGGCWCGVKAL